MSTGRCGARCTASTNTRAPAAWAASTTAATSGIVPSAFDAPVIVTHRVVGPIRSTTVSTDSRPVPVSNGARTTLAPASRAARRHGVMLESCSRRVESTSSPGANVRPTARVNARISVVLFGPKTMPSASAPRKRGHGPAGRPHHLAGRDARREPAAAVRVGAAAQVVAHRGDRGVHHLRAGGAVEPGPPVIDGRKAIAHARTLRPRARRGP